MNKGWFLLYWSFVLLSVLLVIGLLYYVYTPKEISAHDAANKASCHYYLNDGSGDPDCSEGALSNYFKEYTWAAREIASAESTCTPEAQGTNDPSKLGFDSSIPRINYDVGLFQINEYFHCGRTHTCEATGESVTLSGVSGGSSPSSACINELKDPKTNKIVACALSSGGKNWQPWATAQSGYCDLVKPSAGDTPPPGDDDSFGGGGGGLFSGDDCETPTLGPINCNVNFPAIPTPSGMFDLNDLCKEGAQITIGALIAYIYYASLWASGIIAFVSILYAGIMYMLSGARPEARAKAKERLVAVMWGIAILFLSVVVMNLINPDITNLEISPLAIVDPGNCGSSDDGGVEPVDCSEETYTCGFSLSGQECTVASACKPGCKPADFVCSEYSPLLDSGTQCAYLEETGPWACEPITPPGEYYCTWSDSGSCVQAEEYCATGYTPNEESLCEDIGTAEECLTAGPQQCVSSGDTNPYDLGPKQVFCSTGYECQPWCGSVSNEADTRLKTDSEYVNWSGMWPADQTANINDLSLAGWVTSTSRNNTVASYSPFLDALRKAGQTAQSRGYQLFLTSGHRPLYDQVRVLCWGGGRNANASAMDSVIGSLVARPGLSNHGVGVAVDLRLYKDGKQLNKDLASTCSAMAKIMYDSDPGWYRLGHEDWHFEFWADGAPSSSRTRSAFNCT